MNRLKYVIVLIGIFFLLTSIACSSGKSLALISRNYHSPKVSFMDSVRKYSAPREQNFRITLNSRDRLNQIDPDLVQSFLSGSSTLHPETWEITFYDYSMCYYFDYQEYRSWISFSILVDSESGFMQLYQFTYKKRTGKLTTISHIGTYEADGGASRNDTFTYSRSGKKLQVSTQYTYDQDYFDDPEGRSCYTRSFDSIISNFHFYPNKTEFSMDTILSSLDTLCFE